MKKQILQEKEWLCSKKKQKKDMQLKIQDLIQKIPKVTYNTKIMSAQNKQSYSNKGSVPLKKSQKVSVNTNPEPGMGKGKVRGAGKAEFGTKFSGVY